MEQNQYFIGNDLFEKYHELLQEEKHWIIGAYHFGWDDGANNYRPVSDVIYEDGEDFYNKKFNTKEQWKHQCNKLKSS